MALRSRLNLPRATCPVMCSRRHQRAYATTPAAFDLARGLAASARQLATLGGHAASAQQTDHQRHEKRYSGPLGDRRGAPAPDGADGPYSLIHGNKSRKPRQHWLSGRFDGQNHPRERNPSGTTTRP